MTKVIFLTDKNGKPNIFGKGYPLWWYTLKGPKFVVVREEDGA